MSNKKAQRAKERMGYIVPSHIPKCANCGAYKPMVMGMPATSLQPAIQFSPPYCQRGNFAVKPEATCGEWHKRSAKKAMADRQSMNPGFLDGIETHDLKMARAGEAYGAKVPRLAAEWGNN